MIETFRGDRGASFGFRQDKATLRHRLNVQRQAFRRPGSPNPMLAHRGADIGFECFDMATDVLFAGGAYVRMGPVGFLDDGAHKAGEIG